MKTERINEVGLLTLDRPEKLNALTLAMCQLIDDQLADWENDDRVKVVMIRGNGDRAFCAGGDISVIYHNGPGKVSESLAFFKLEYQMNKRISHYKKPYIALMHGITMGGGLGVSVHGSCRIADPNIVMAMPETGIGFYPDIGGTYFLSRARGELGTYFGLTGARMSAADAQYLDLIDYVVSHNNFDDLVKKITQADLKNISSVDDIVTEFSETLEAPGIKNYETIITRCFAKNSVEEIYLALEEQGDGWSKEVLETLQKKSPTSLRLTLAHLRQANELSFDDCMAAELKLTEQFLNGRDFYEGVRAAVIDKDNAPSFSK